MEYTPLMLNRLTASRKEEKHARLFCPFFLSVAHIHAKLFNNADPWKLGIMLTGYWKKGKGASYGPK